MRIYQNAVEAVKETEREVMEMGKKVYNRTVQDIFAPDGINSRELIGYSLMLEDGTDWPDGIKAMGMGDDCIRYVSQEFLDRVTKGSVSRNPGHSYLRRLEVWDKFLEGGKKFAYTYGERIQEEMGFNQDESVHGLHAFDKGSRQLIIQIYNQTLDGPRRGGKRRVPCTMHYQILNRDDEVTLIHVMRSCDLYTHFPIDLSISWLMAKHYKAMMGAKCAKVIMQIGSLHAFEKDLQARGVF